MSTVAGSEKIGKKTIAVHRGYIARIKHKILITILSLLELSENDFNILNRVRRTVPLGVLS